MYRENKQSNQAAKNEYMIEFLSHVDEPIDKYDIYLHSGTKPRDPTSNARNIFDDSNIEDRKWFGAAKKYLSRAR
jgi:hypothetical protein